MTEEQRLRRNERMRAYRARMTLEQKAAVAAYMRDYRLIAKPNQRAYEAAWRARHAGVQSGHGDSATML